MKWLIALCLLLASLILGLRSLQDSALNHQLYDRQRELGYPSKKKPFWIGKRIVSVLFMSAAIIVLLPLNHQTINNEAEPKPMTVMQYDNEPQEKAKAIMLDDSQGSSSITLNMTIKLISKSIDVSNHTLLGFYEAEGKTYNVYVIDDELIFQDQEGNTYRNQME